MASEGVGSQTEDVARFLAFSRIVPDWTVKPESDPAKCPQMAFRKIAHPEAVAREIDNKPTAWGTSGQMLVGFIAPI